MDDLDKYLSFVYEQETGYVYVATKDSNAKWERHYFQWPEQKQSISDFISLNRETLDVYIAPALFKNKSSLKSSVRGSNVVWVEFDGQEQIDFATQKIPQPDLIVQSSSSTHLHCYWKIPFSSVDVLEDINRRLTYHLEADSSGWDANQVLRPPDSKNWKHDGVDVTMIHFRPKLGKYKLEDFDSAPAVKSKPILLNETLLEDPNKLLNTLPLSAKLRKKIISETVSQGSRSHFLMRIAHELAEEGCTHVQITSLLLVVDDRLQKFVGRHDRLLRLSEIAAIALLDIDPEGTIILYSPLEIINHTEELTWILPGWLHQSGFVVITGMPGSGKTTLCLQLMYHLTAGENFLGKDLDTCYKVLFISLEMGIIELKYFFKHQELDFENKEAWNLNLRVLDEEKNLIDYETIIEEFAPNVVVIDSITELASDELKETEARAIIRWIRKVRRKYNVGFVCIHHNRKEQSAGKKRPARLGDLYGSFIFGKDAETVINLEPDEDDDTKLSFYSLKTRFGPGFEMALSRSENLTFSLREQNDPSTKSIGPAGAKINFKIN